MRSCGEEKRPLKGMFTEPINREEFLLVVAFAAAPTPTPWRALAVSLLEESFLGRGVR
jgi:hypothetical protein